MKWVDQLMCRYVDYLIYLYICAPKMEKSIYRLTFNILIMGKGDKKTKKGKIWNGSFGKSRPKKKAVKHVAAKPSA